MQDSIEVVVNGRSGSFSDEAVGQIETLFQENGTDVNVYVANDTASFYDVLRRAAEGSASVIVAAGGDGTVSSVASAVIEADKTLGVLPMGTLNNFSRDLGIPQDLADAVRLIAENYVREIDVGEVNGRTFINNSSIGIYPRLVLKREQQQRLGRGKWWAAAWAAWQMFRISPFYRVLLEADGKDMYRKTPFVFVGNNKYEMELYNIGRRERLDGGKLSVYLFQRKGRWGLILLIIKTLLGRLKQAREFEEFQTTELTIQTRRNKILVAADGEVMVSRSPLEYRIQPRTLRVIVPRAQ